jgi:endonuclease-3
MLSPRLPSMRARGLVDGLSAFAHSAASGAPDARPSPGVAREDARDALCAATASTVTPKRQRAKRPKGGADDDAARSRSPKQSSARKRKVVALDAPPAGWRDTWDLIVELRADRSAVVDKMGTEVAAAVCADEDERAFHSLVSLMLSSQTKDTMNALVMGRLRAHGLSVQSINAMADEKLLELIYGVGFHNNKVRYIKQATAIIAEQHGGLVPRSMEQLLALPGVGPKMALIQMNVAFGECVGISVDTHVHRIANQLGWTGDEPTKMPEKTREALESWMPRDIWPEVNLVLVGLGQEVQTEKAKLLGKCLACSDSARALGLLATLGVDVERELKRLEAPNSGCELKGSRAK